MSLKELQTHSFSSSQIKVKGISERTKKKPSYVTKIKISAYIGRILIAPGISLRVIISMSIPSFFLLNFLLFSTCLFVSIGGETIKKRRT